jgi:hypothetical protein
MLELGIGQDLQCLLRFLLLDPAHCKTDMDQHPIAEAGFERLVGTDDAGEVDPAADAADIDRDDHRVSVIERDDLPGHAEAHQTPPSISRAAAIAGCPRPKPVIGGDCGMAQDAVAQGPQPLRHFAEQDRVLKAAARQRNGVEGPKLGNLARHLDDTTS